MTTTNNLIEQVGGIERAKLLNEMLWKHAVPDNWKISIINGMWHRSSVGFTHSDLRIAIAQYELLGNSEDVTDMVTDIRNHISPMTKVIDHG